MAGASQPRDAVTAARVEALRSSLAGLGSLLVAFSGGADSAFLVAAAIRALGRDHVLAVTAVSPSLPQAERRATEEVAAAVGARHRQQYVLFDDYVLLGPSRAHDNKVLVQRDCYKEVRERSGSRRTSQSGPSPASVPRSKSRESPLGIQADIDRLRRPHLLVPRMGLDGQPDAPGLPPADRHRTGRTSEASRSREPSPPPLNWSSGRADSSCTSRSAEKLRSRSSLTTSLASIWELPGSPPRATTPKGTAASPSRRSAASTTCNGSGFRGRGTKGAKKKLRRLSGKEARFRRHENHCISKTIVQTAKDTGRGIAVEDLKGIRGRITARGGDARNRLSGWSFHQLVGFLSYKAQDAGIPIVQVDPRNTSKTCSVCGHCEKANRKSQSEFLCKHCGFSANADWNAARNIRALAASKAAIELAVVEAKTGNRICGRDQPESYRTSVRVEPYTAASIRSVVTT